VVRAERKREYPGGEFYLPCALIIRRLQPGERSHVNEILRELGVSAT
jgi:2,3,4,5-tetrahydropyridine-2,6-dicarboxylate N-succinyltransferase